MGRKSTFETIARIMVAFLKEDTWTQVDLAKECEVSVKALRQRLLELSERMPLSSDSEPPHVYWTIPKGWFPDGRLLDPQQVALIARLLARLPASPQRSQALQAVFGMGQSPPASTVDLHRDAVLAALEDAARARHVANIDYFSATRGDRGTREVSVHRVLYGQRLRVVATCHRSGTLKLFRVDQVHHATPVNDAVFRAVSEQDLSSFLMASIDGFRAPGEVATSSFVVRFPEARWVARNLPDAPIDAEHIAEGIRFTARVAGVDQLARFVVGLGDAARAETQALRARIQELALGALRELKPPHKLNARSVRPIRATK